MYEEDAVEPQEQMDEIIDQAMPDDNVEIDEPQEEAVEKATKMVPLSALQKERMKKRELELELQWERQRNAAQPKQQPEEDDNSRYESATKEDLRLSQEESLRAIEERLWIRQNPEKFEEVQTNLESFLNKRPNLAAAIKDAPNRFQEAYELMNALSPKQRQQMKQPQPKKEAPNSPGSVPKSAALNDAVDVMRMSDAEFAAWRASKRSRR